MDQPHELAQRRQFTPRGEGEVANGDGGSASWRDKGAREAAEAVAAGKLLLREFPPLPSPPAHGTYVQLLRERCGVEYEVPTLPPGVAEADFFQEVRAGNEVVEAEIARKHGAGILDQLREEARQGWQAQIKAKGTE